jgi:parallel beta-helix repeat protein
MKTSRLFTCLLISLLAASALTGMEFAGLTKANPSSITMVPIEHAYIRSNGVVDPPTLPIQRSENFYALQGNLLNYSIEIQKDNIVFDGNGFTLTSIFPDAPQGMTSGFPSIQILDLKNVTVRNVVFDKCYTAVSVKNSTSVMLYGNVMEMGEEGIYMDSCRSCSVIGNKLVDNSRTGFMIMNSSYLNISNNVISRNRSHGGWLAVDYSTISRNNITDNISSPGIGLYLYGPNSNNDIFENNFVNNSGGLFYQG